MYCIPEKASILWYLFFFIKEAFQGAFCASEIFSNLSRMHSVVETMMVYINAA